MDIDFTSVCVLQLRSSFSKAFGGDKTKKKKTSSVSDIDGADSLSLRSADVSVPNSPLLTVPHPMTAPTTPIKGSHSSSALSDSSDTVLDLQQQLHEKDMKLTDIRLEALSSAAQLEQLRDAMNKMKVCHLAVVLQ